jgi:hypothetical protein
MTATIPEVTLATGGVEYIHWTLSGLPTSPPVAGVSVSLDRGVTWHPAELTGGEARILLAHPAATEPDPGAVVAPRSVEMLVRIEDTPEVVVRSGGALRIGS